MPSRADLRVAGEWALRAGALGLLAWALWSALRPEPAGRHGPGATLVIALDTAAPREQLERATRRRDLAALHVTLTQAPGRAARDWLRAIRGAGTTLSWEGTIPALALAAEPLADPRGGVRVTVAGPSGAPLVLADAAGRIDSLVPSDGGASVRVTTVVGPLSAHAAGAAASVPPPGGRALRTVVVLGRAGWEAKFVTAALEEEGWRVSARMPVAPGLVVGPEAPRLDTAAVGVVVALDSTASPDAAAIARFVRAGGGLVLAPEAARLPAFAALAVGRAGAPGPATYAEVIASVTRQSLAAAPLAALRSDAVPLERRNGGVLVAARRVDGGRVVQIGYEETWRWRMAGGEDAPEAHRRWWSELVGAVAYAPIVPAGPMAAAAARSEPAPRAALIAALGEATDAPAGVAAGDAFDPSRSLLVYIAAALLLLAEWASRRLRGAR